MQCRLPELIKDNVSFSCKQKNHNYSGSIFFYLLYRIYKNFIKILDSKKNSKK